MKAHMRKSLWVFFFKLFDDQAYDDFESYNWPCNRNSRDEWRML